MTSVLRPLHERRWEFAAVCVLFGLPLLFADWSFLSALRFSEAWMYRETLLRGLFYTTTFAFLAIFVGYPTGVVLAIASRSRWVVLRGAVVGYVEFWRNTPLLVQLFWIHFALPFATGFHTSALQSGAIAIVANVAAFYSEIARAGINSVASGQWEACRALGFRRVQIWRLVILPQALRIIIPPSTNLVISIVKATSILSILGIGELMRETVRLSNHTFRVVEFYTVAALLYIIIGLLVAYASGQVERHLKAQDGRDGI